jgi:type II secretory pathway component PulF
VRTISRLPIVAGVVKNIDLWRFSRSMHLLLSSGMTITSSLELTEKIMVKPEIAQAIAYTHQQVLTGKPISSSLKQHPKVFHTNIIELVLAGEKTGSLDQSLKHIAEYLDDEIAESIERLMTMMEPVLLVIVAILVGAMMLSIIGPIYGMIGGIAPNLK